MTFQKFLKNNCNPKSATMPISILLEDDELEWLIEQCRHHADMNDLLHRLEEACQVSRLLHRLKTRKPCEVSCSNTMATSATSYIYNRLKMVINIFQRHLHRSKDLKSVPSQLTKHRCLDTRSSVLALHYLLPLHRRQLHHHLLLSLLHLCRLRLPTKKRYLLPTVMSVICGKRMHRWRVTDLCRRTPSESYLSWQSLPSWSSRTTAKSRLLWYRQILPTIHI